MENFDPNDISIPNGNYFALPYTVDESPLVLISAPWDVTTSYRAGAAFSPDAILDASGQVDLYDYDFGDNYKKGIGTHPFDEDMLERSKRARLSAENVISRLEIGLGTSDRMMQKSLDTVNEACAAMNKSIYSTASHYFSKGKKVGLVGGDHSTALGIIKAAAEEHEGIGLLQIDAHADLREAYEGFNYSHASVMYNALREAPGISRLTQVAIRDYSEQELEIMRSDDRIQTFFDRTIHDRMSGGESWKSVCDDIIATLPEYVHISLDIDGLCLCYCPNTGTPVPGGLSFNQMAFLLKSIAESGRKVVGFDLTEVVGKGNDIDASVGARLLYKLSLLTLEEI